MAEYDECPLSSDDVFKTGSRKSIVVVFVVSRKPILLMPIRWMCAGKINKNSLTVLTLYNIVFIVLDVRCEVYR